MRFGVSYEHRLPRPWEPDGERRLRAEALEQVEVADRVGFDCVWQVEHHFLEEYSHGSAPDVFLAAASQRASRVRLGFGILPLPPAYHHPARVAETAATLDLVSGGRVELGTGETSSGVELEGFGVDRATKRAQWDEALDVLTRMFRRGAVRRRARTLRADAAAQRAPQARAAPASAAVGRLLAARHDPPGRREGDWRAELLVRRARGGRRLGRGVRATAFGRPRTSVCSGAPARASGRAAVRDRPRREDPRRDGPRSVGSFTSSVGRVFGCSPSPALPFVRSPCEHAFA